MPAALDKEDAAPASVTPGGERPQHVVREDERELRQGGEDPAGRVSVRIRDRAVRASVEQDPGPEVPPGHGDALRSERALERVGQRGLPGAVGPDEQDRPVDLARAQVSSWL